MSGLENQEQLTSLAMDQARNQTCQTTEDPEAITTTEDPEAITTEAEATTTEAAAIIITAIPAAMAVVMVTMAAVVSVAANQEVSEGATTTTEAEVTEAEVVETFASTSSEPATALTVIHADFCTNASKSTQFKISENQPPVGVNFYVFGSGF